MTVSPDNLIMQVRSRALVLTAAVAMSMIVADAGWPQAAAPPPALGIREPGTPVGSPQDGSVSAPAAAAAEENPGMFDAMGKLFDKTISILPPLKSPQQTIDDWNSRARDTANDASAALSRLARPSTMVSGRMKCPVAGNGAPDCKLGANQLCQAKGFKEGSSLDSDSAQTCSGKMLIPGRARKPDDCRTDNYVTRALCS